MKYGSLCSGVGGLDLAVEQVFGAEPAWFCENDPAAVSVLNRWWPNVPVHPDVKTHEWERTERVRLVTAGYPCQPFSHAGSRKGAADPRHLWPYVIGAVRVLGPDVVVLENVAGHLGLGFDVVLGDLAEAGFDAEWTVVPASAVGACHRRERLFVVAYADRVVGQETDPGGRGRGTVDEHGEVAGVERLHRLEAAADAYRAGLEGRTTDSELARELAVGLRSVVDWGDYEPAVRRWEHVIGRPAPTPTDERGRLSVPFVEWMMGFPEGWVDGLGRTAALRCLGNAVVPQQGALALTELTA